MLRRLRNRALLNGIVRRDNRGHGVSLRHRLRRPLARAVVIRLIALSLAAVVTSTWPTIEHLSAQISPPDAAGGKLTGRAYVIDGDTLDIRGQRIRLWGIDAPESSQLCRRDERPWQCGRDAANALADWIGTRTVRCEDRGRDRYRRVIGLCYAADSGISAWMVERGWAVAYRRYSSDYIGQEDRARAARLGIWASEFEMPWDWRAHRRTPTGR